MHFSKRRVLKSSEIDLGSAVLDRETGRIFCSDGNELELRHQSREVLAALAKRPGETVTQQALIDNVWSGRSVSADSVAQCIAEIRRALGDTDKRIIETVPSEGYRLIWLLRPDAPNEAPVIAVLPFDDFSTPPHKGYLSDAVSESIINALAHNPQQAVISRRSSFQFRNSDLGVSEIAAQLGADFVVEGSQQYDGTRLRITAQLIDGASEAHIWADEIDVPLQALLETNSQISRKIANAVGTSVLDTAQARMTAGDVSALMISNAAQSRIMRNYTRENLLLNIEEQELAIRDFPDSAWGYLGQALALRNGLSQGWIEGNEKAARKRMYELARRGVALDPNNFMAHHALGRVLMYNRDVEAATGAFRRGVKLNPSSSIVTNGLVESLILVGKTDEAFELIERLELIDPLYGFGVQWNKGWALWQVGECDKALKAFQSTPSMPIAANKMLAAIHHCQGDQDKADKAMADYLANNSNWTVSRERAVNSGMWTAPGVLERWLVAMKAVGMPM